VNRCWELSWADGVLCCCVRCGLGLRKVLKVGESVPEMFEDAVVKRASHWVLSTSALYSKHLREYGWGEVRTVLILRSQRFSSALLTSTQVVPDGFGVAYMTGCDGEWLSYGWLCEYVIIVLT